MNTLPTIFGWIRQIWSAMNDIIIMLPSGNTISVYWFYISKAIYLLVIIFVARVLEQSLKGDNNNHE